MAAMSTLQDNEALAALYKDALSPINNYSQGLLSLALQKRQEEKQAATTAAEHAFQLQRDESQSALVLGREKEMEKIRQDAETARQKMASDRAISDYKAKLQVQLEFDDAATKKKAREGLEKQANQIGLKEPSKMTNDELVTAVAHAKGTQLIDSAKVMHKTLVAYAQAKQQSLGDVWGDAMGQAISSLNSASPAELKKTGLTVQDLEDLKDPAKSKAVIARVIKNSKAYSAVTELQAKAGQVMATDMNLQEKSKLMQQGYADQFKAANETYQSFLKEHDTLPQEDVRSAMEELTKAAVPQPPQQQITPPGRPSPAFILRGMGANAPATQPGVYPITPEQAASVQPAPPARTPYSFQGGPALTIPNFNAPAGANVMMPGSIPNPQLQNFLNKNTRAQNAIAPSAFPADDSVNF
jgi:hypothetical protein